jgi:transcriptional regulator with XRE-family HTH domain
MVGHLIRKRRRALGWSQEVLAEKMGWQQTYLSRVERGEVELPQRATLEKLSDVLGIGLPEFYRASGILEGVSDEAPAPPPETDDEDALIAWVKTAPGESWQRDWPAEIRRLGPDGGRAWLLEMALILRQSLRLLATRRPGS